MKTAGCQHLYCRNVAAVSTWQYSRGLRGSGHWPGVTQCVRHTPVLIFYSHPEILMQGPHHFDFCIKLPKISIFGASLMKLWKHLAGICCWTVGVITEIRAEIWIWITSFIFICEFAYLYLCIFVFSFCICESAFVYLYFYIYVFAVGVIREIGAQSLNLDQDLIGHRSLRFSSVSDSSLYFWSFMVAVEELHMYCFNGALWHSIQFIPFVIWHYIKPEFLAI